MKTISFITGAVIAFGIALLVAPVSGKELRRILFDPEYENDRDGDPHTFNIKELISENSASLEEIKEKLD
jgi:gas vesicle protein